MIAFHGVSGTDTTVKTLLLWVKQLGAYVAVGFIPHHLRAGSSVRENTGLSSAVVIGRGVEGRKVETVKSSNKTLEAPQVSWQRVAS